MKYRPYRSMTSGQKVKWPAHIVITANLRLPVNQELGLGFPSTSGTVIEMATIHTREAAIRNRIARKYRAGIIDTRTTGNRSTPRALKPQIMRAQRSPCLKKSAQ